MTVLACRLSRQHLCRTYRFTLTYIHSSVYSEIISTNHPEVPKEVLDRSGHLPYNMA
jgi:hypothetical protein